MATNFTGNITKNAVTRNSSRLDANKNPVPVTTFTVAENWQYNGVKGVRYHTVELWGNRGVNLAEYLKSGRSVTIEQAYEDAVYWVDRSNTIHPYLRSRNPYVIKFNTAYRGEEEPVEPVAELTVETDEPMPFDP